MGLQLQVKTFVPVASSTTALGAAQTVSGAANFTLTSAATSGTYANDNTAPKVSFTSSGNISGVNFTVTGTDVNGDAQSEVIAGPNATTVPGSNLNLSGSGVPTIESDSNLILSAKISIYFSKSSYFVWCKS